MQAEVMNYFWALDNEIPADFVKGYRQAAGNRQTLGRIVDLLEGAVPVPPRAYLTSDFYKKGAQGLPRDFLAELGKVITRFEKLTGQTLGASQKPMLLTLHGDFSGAVRNVGCHLEALPALVHSFGAGKAYTVYVDFLESFSSLVLGCPHIDFRSTFDIKASREGGAGGLAALRPEEFTRFVLDYQNLVSQKIGAPFPTDPARQLMAALARFAMSAKDAGGDEIFLNVQLHRSQYGESVHGVAYTRNPFTGKADLYGVYECGAESKKGPLEPANHGADATSELETEAPVAAGADNAAEPGASSAKPKAKGARGRKAAGGAKAAPRAATAPKHAHSLRQRFPAVYTQLRKFLPEIEAGFRDVMEVEFLTDEDGHLYFTNFDKAQTTAKAAVVSAMELNASGKIDDAEAAMRIKPADLEVLLHPTLDEDSKRKLQDLGSTGVTASPGTAVGHVFFKMDDAIKHYHKATKSKGDKRVILVADELLISDTPGLGMISGLVTTASGIASHAAVMARANGIPCLVGYAGIEFDHKTNTMTVNGRKVKAGTKITVDASGDGRIYLGEGKLHNLSHKEGVVRDVSKLMSRVIQNERIPMEVRVNINNAKDAATGISFGADGVGLCRTENMFMEPEALKEIRTIVYGGDAKRREEGIQKLEEIQYEDFKKIFEVMQDRVVNIRLMDLPLHDFVPQNEKQLEDLSKSLKHLKKEQIRQISEGLREHNPMLGLRACRFGIIQPEVYNMQIRAIVRAAYTVAKTGVAVNPGIMFPLVSSEEELMRLRARVVAIEGDIREKLRIPFGEKIHVRVGTMMELPAAALSCDKLARVSEFFAFGTNDLTQTTLGMSRDDSAHYLPQYLEMGVLKADPFKQLAAPVRELIEIAVRRGHRTRIDASFGICGEQGGDPSTLTFCLDKGLNYVSCSPFRVLPTRAALVHTALQLRKEREKAREREKRSNANGARAA